MIRRWSPEDLDTLRELYGTMPVAELSRMLDRSVGTLYVMASTLGLTRARAGKPPQETPEAREPEDLEPEPQPAPVPSPAVVAPVRPAQHIVRAAADALIRHGVDEASAHIAAGAIARGQVPALRFALYEESA